MSPYKGACPPRLKKGNGETMGSIALEGSFFSGLPKQKFLEMQFINGMETGFDPYGGGFYTIEKFHEKELISREYKSPIFTLESWMKKHPEYKSNSELITSFLKNRSDRICKWEMIYTVDYSSPCGFEITTYGGRQEIDIKNLNKLPKSWIDSLNPKDKGYTVFTVGIVKTFKDRKRTFGTLKEIDDVIRKDVIRYQQNFFIIKNDCSKFYVVRPNIKVVDKTNKETYDHSNNLYFVRKRYPVYYFGWAGC